MLKILRVQVKSALIKTFWSRLELEVNELSLSTVELDLTHSICTPKFQPFVNIVNVD